MIQFFFWKYFFEEIGNLLSFFFVLLSFPNQVGKIYDTFLFNLLWLRRNSTQYINQGSELKPVQKPKNEAPFERKLGGRQRELLLGLWDCVCLFLKPCF